MTWTPYPALLALVVLVVYARPALAFGAGNIAGISKIEGQNWRHGDIEDTLLTLLMARVVGGKKFDKLAVSRVYFGNWLRDYSQAIDVGTVKSVSAEAIRLLLCVLGFLSFGFGSKEFEVTAERLGCYRPEDHIDNPKNYADNLDARDYDPRLRGPVDEGVELAIDEETGMKNYIANESVGIMSSAEHVRKLFRRCIMLGRKYNRDRDDADFYEALRLLGTGLHCLEDFLAHSNYVELALIEMGEQDVFPMVGSRTLMQIKGVRHEVFPCVTGTFGGVDFLHSVTGEVSDKMTQNEVDELEGVLQNNAKDDHSVIADLLDKIPSGIIGGGSDKKQKMNEIQDNAANAQMESMSVSPRETEEYTLHIQRVFEQIMPAIELHDEILKSITEKIEKIPILPKLIENLEDQMSIWVFSIMAPFVVPIINQVKNELRTGSSEIIESSKNEQLNVFEDDEATDPTHSMLSKDHFSNILNEAAGKTASKVVAWVVPQIMEAWDDDSIDVKHLNDRIVHGVMHHPGQRNMGQDHARECRRIMYHSVEGWWNDLSDEQKDDYRRKLSRDGVMNGENHKEGVEDSGHGCGGHLGMQKKFTSTEDKIASGAADAIMGGLTGGIGDFVKQEMGVDLPSADDGSKYGKETSGGLGGFLGSVLGGFKNKDKESFSSSRRDEDSYTESRTEYGHSGNRYGQAEVSETRYADGEEEIDYKRYEQDQGRGGTNAYGFEERIEERPARSGGYEERTDIQWQQGGRNFEQDSGWRHEDRRGQYGFEEPRQQQYGYGGGGGRGQEQQYGYGGGGERRQEQYGGGYGGEERRGEGGYGYGGGEPERREEGGGYGGGYGRAEEPQEEWEDPEEKERRERERRHHHGHHGHHGDGGGGGGGWGF